MLLGRLALAFGRPLYQLLNELPAHEFAFWEAYETLDGPIGYSRLDLLAAWFGHMSGKSLKANEPEDSYAAFLNYWFTIANPPIPPEELDDKTQREEMAMKVFEAFGFPPDFKGFEE